VRIADLDLANERVLEALAVLSYAAARSHFPNWLPTLEHAREQVRDAIAEHDVTRIAVSSDGIAIGWISCIHAYGQVWEIHPLLVDPAHQRRGCGAALVRDVEAIVASRGGGVLTLGTADETNGTSLGGIDLFRDPIAALAAITAAPDHPLQFWRHVGFTVVGVTPDAEGPGMPTIHLAKRVR
jgi:aminoglycoside 6'-N-acetyltransferase I